MCSVQDSRRYICGRSVCPQGLHKKILATFGEITLTEELVATSEEFLVECLASKEAKATGVKTFALRSLHYGYREAREGENEGGLMPVIIPEDTLPENFPHPCSCLKCAKPNVCCCRIDGIACCDFCQCKAKCNYTTNYV